MQIERFLLTRCKNNANNNIYSFNNRQEFLVHFLSIPSKRSITDSLPTDHNWDPLYHKRIRHMPSFFTINWRAVFPCCSNEIFNKVWCCIHMWKSWLIWFHYRSPFPIQTTSTLNNYTDIIHVLTSTYTCTTILQDYFSNFLQFRVSAVS